MPRSRSANRRSSSIKKVSVRPSLKNAKCSRFQHSSLEYDDDKTQFSNYARLGLMADANQIGVVKDKITGFKPRVKVPDRAGIDEDDATSSARREDGRHPLELEVPEALKTVRKVPDGERTVLLKLMAKHGDDYAAMSRDLRLNALQHTAAHLRRRIEKMKDEDEDEEQEAAALVPSERAQPPAQKRKTTRDPNPAFRKRSMNFN